MSEPKRFLDAAEMLYRFVEVARFTFRYAVLTLVLLGLGVAQAATGFLGDSAWMRYGYPVVCLLMTIPCGLGAWAGYLVAVDQLREGADDEAQ